MKPTCEVKILPAIWLQNPEYMTSKREIDRGISEYNLTKKPEESISPF